MILIKIQQPNSPIIQQYAIKNAVISAASITK